MSGSARESRYKAPEPHLPYGFVDDMPIDHDPLDPHPEHPTPLDLVMRLTMSERETRAKALVELSRRKFEEGMDRLRGKNIVGVCALVSGGNDSYTVAHVFRDVTTHHVHANTETGIDLTRQFVRATAKDWGVPLIEHTPPEGQGYFDLVRGNVMAVSKTTGELVRAWPGGFPGPSAHATMFDRLKGRSLARVPHDFGISGSRTDRVVFIAGRRRPESKVRASIPYFDSRGTIEWISPMAVWHKADLRAYRLMIEKKRRELESEIRLLHFQNEWAKTWAAAPVPRNPVAKVIGMSGECGCLAYGSAGEPERWRKAYPDDPFIVKVNEVEEELRDRTDIPEHRKKWGWGGAYVDPDEIEDMPPDSVCGTSCGHDPLLDMMDPLFNLEATS